MTQRYPTHDRSPISEGEPSGWDSAGQIRCEPSWSGYRVLLIGEVDLTLAHQWDQVFETLEDGDPADVTVDLSAATFIDSSALGSFVRLHRTVSARGHGTTLTGVAGSVARTISLAGIDRLISVVPVSET